MKCAVSDDDTAITSTLETKRNVDQKQSQKQAHNSENSFYWIYKIVREKMKIDLSRSRIHVKRWQRFEFTMLVVSIIVVWGLVLLPIVFYYSPSSKGDSNGRNKLDDKISNTSGSNRITNGSGNSFSGGLLSGNGILSDACMVKYEGRHCKKVLQSRYMCLLGKNSTDIYISSRHNDYMKLESQIAELLFALDIAIQPSKECKAQVIPFLCFFMFGLCSETNNDHQPTAAECFHVKDNVCKLEWKKANDLLSRYGKQRLPECNSFSSSDELLCTNDNLTEVPCTLECHEQFYCDNNFCKPRCDRFREFSSSYVTATDAVIVFSAVVCVVTGIFVLVFTCLRYKRMLTFPTVILVYMTLILQVFGITVLISFMGRPSLFCDSIDLVENIQSSTGFCKLSGAVFYYVLLQTSLWWISHILILFWKIQFPLHSSRFEKAHSTKHIHITIVILAILLPVITVISSEINGGYTLTRFPTILCTGANIDVTFYTLVLPIVIIIGCGTTVLMVIFWKIHKHQGLFRSKLKKTPINIGTAERKILLVFLYYISLGAVASTAFSLATKYQDYNINETLNYFDCQKSGFNNTCKFSIKHFPTVTVVAYVLVGLLPSINLVYAFNVKEIKYVLKGVYFRVRNRVKSVKITTTEGKSQTTSMPGSTEI